MTRVSTSQRRWVVAISVLVMEVLLYRRYALLGTQLHFWLHLLHGVAFGLGAFVLVNLLRRHPATPVGQLRDRGTNGAWPAMFGGHLYAAMPDFLFISTGALHVRWMDVFAIHIRIHMVPGALWVSLGLMVLALASWVALGAGHRTASWAAVFTLVVSVSVALFVAPPIPQTLEEVRVLADRGLWCPLQIEGQ